VEWAELLMEDKKNDLAIEKLKQSEKVEADPKALLAARTAYIRAQTYQKLELVEPAINSLKSISQEVRKELVSERASAIEECDKLLKTLEHQLAINQGNVEVVLAASVETLTKQPDGLDALTELATSLENIGKAYAGKKEFDKAISYFGASMLAYQAVRTVDEKHSLTNLNRLNNSYHQARRDKGDPAAPKAFLVRREAKWKYLDGGSVAPEKWNQPDFDASQWKEGLGPLGYGDKDLGTSIEPGGDKKNRPITCYFRTTFEIPENTPMNSLLVNVRRDDGVVLYLNGAELLRDNMPDGTIKPETLAKTRIDKDEAVYLRHDLKTEHVKIGTNTLAAEVHQGKADSSDLGLDVEFVMNPSFPVETVKSLDKAAIMKTLGAIWDKLPEATRTLLTTEPK
jgi:tetratricopeptide (TPR) repeat protein